MEKREAMQNLLILYRIGRTFVRFVVLYQALLSLSLEVIVNQVTE